MILAMSTNPTGRKRGGQPGNQNRLLHGIYSKLVSNQDGHDVESMPPNQNEPELALARIRLKNCIEKQKAAPLEQWLAYEKTITHYLGMIAALTHRNAILGKEDTPAMMTVMEMIRQVNEEQDVK